MNVCPRCGCPSSGPRCRRCLGVTLPISGSNGNGMGDLGLFKKVRKKLKRGVKKVGTKLGNIGKSIATTLVGGGMPLLPAENVAGDLEAEGITAESADAAAQAALDRYRTGGGKLKSDGLSKTLPYVAAGVAALALLGVAAMTTGVRRNKQQKRRNVTEQ